ncbi:hypothetical protein BTVI_106430 [Pitangus sulphuratus]|nr:hypothetical protein BTVI_106430 [Pitangus sulphuratus]
MGQSLVVIAMNPIGSLRQDKVTRQFLGPSADKGTSVTPVSEATSMEQSRDPSMQPSTELPPDYSGDSHKENDTEQVGNTGTQESGQITWELSGEPSTEFTPKPSMEPSQEPTQESSTEISGRAKLIPTEEKPEKDLGTYTV